MMPAEYDVMGKVVFITGAGRGIGKGIAQVLAEAGADIALNALTTKYVNDTAAGIAAASGRRVVPIIADVTTGVHALAAVGLALELGHDLRHHLALVAGAFRAGLSDNLLRHLDDLVAANLLGHVGLENGHLRLFLGHQVGAVARFEGLDALLVLLDGLGQHAEDIGVGGGGIPGDFGVLDASEAHANGIPLDCIPAPQALLQIIVQLNFQACFLRPVTLRGYRASQANCSM